MHHPNALSSLVFPALLLTVLLLGSPAHADPTSDLHGELKERWYTTELVVFRYTNPPAAESLQLTGERMNAQEYAKALAANADAQEGGEIQEAVSVLTLGDRPEDVALTQRPPLAVRPKDKLLAYTGDADLEALIAQNMATWEHQLRDQDGDFLSKEQLTLTDQATKLRSNRGIEVLTHTGWTQAVPARDNGTPISLSGGTTYIDPRNGDSRFRLEGEVTVTLGRYLHVQPTLYYTPVTTTESRLPTERSQPGRNSAANTQAPGRVPEVKDLSSLSALDRLKIRAAEKSAARAQRSNRRPEESALELPPYTRLEQSRRVRSGELHYIDHPELGVLVRVTPVAAPELLLEQFTLLQ